ncbi:LOW QUALITY PROTEIN: serologically defined colon cancer antigen 8-like [Daphnia carinata]|uniref:LOW QUALITY PROTEIN: serologically defined colon cancer antigen 8-like n=1 Tax=Daphnia carinata TaxID=120202 RepID=UPI00257B3BA8|nr:LOW QUALITY PROTEIN: serologically defined colon cancer antigen 8-like [Daphnia carinata]
MDLRRSDSPDEYYRAVHQLKQFLSESDSSDHQVYKNGLKDSVRHNATSSENSETKSLSARKSLFKSPLHHKTGFVVEGNSTDYILIGWIQKQMVYTKALEKEVAFYRKQMPGIISETKVMISNEESNRMGQANAVTQRLFSLIDTISNAKLSISHESCEVQRKKLMQDLAAAQHQIQILTHQWAEHTCWNGQDKSKLPEDISREKSDLLSTVNMLRSTVSSLQQREADALGQVQQSVEVAEQAQLERVQMENEVRRLVSLVDQHEQQMATLNAEHSRRLQEERTRWESKLAEQVSALKRERDLRDEALTRLSLDLEQSQRNEAVLKNEIQIKSNLLESSRQDFQRQISQMQSEQGRLAGQQAELQRRLGEAELRAELNCKASEQEANSVRVEAEFLRRKIDLLSKEADNRKKDYDKAIKELEQRNLELHLAASQREGERVQAVKSGSQASSLVKYLEQREVSLLHSLQEAKRKHDERCREMTNIIDEQRSIIQTLKEEYAALIEDFQKSLVTDGS